MDSKGTNVAEQPTLTVFPLNGLSAETSPSPSSAPAVVSPASSAAAVVSAASVPAAVLSAGAPLPEHPASTPTVRAVSNVNAIFFIIFSSFHSISFF